MRALSSSIGRGWRRLLRLAVAVSLAAATAGSALAAPRVVAVGDVHGGLQELLSILEEADLADEHGRWIGGTATLVQIGDLLDRGADVRLVVELMIGLQEQASKAGGEVIVLIGNHEAMNLLGIHRDVNPEAYTGFADRNSDKLRRRAFRKFTEHLRRQARATGQPAPVLDSETEERFMAIFPRGRLEYMAALGPKGEIGRWLRTLPVAAVVGDTLFIHGGVPPGLSATSVEAMNRTVKGEIEIADEVRSMLEAVGTVPRGLASYSDLLVVAEAVVEAVDSGRQVGWSAKQIELLRQFAASPEWHLLNPDGPLWFRGITGWETARYEPTLAETLAFHEVERVVVGHTPDVGGRISDRFGGRAYCIDTGMLSSFYRGGRPSALEIAGDTVVAIYPDGREELTGVPAGVDEPQGQIGEDPEPLDPARQPGPLDSPEEAVEPLSEVDAE